jgi:hypothetical protein
MYFTLVESSDVKRALVVRQVDEADTKAVRRWGGYLFATMAEAEEFARSERQFGDGGPPWARGTFGRKRVDGRRIYIGLIPGGG